MKIIVWAFTFYPFMLIPATMLFNLDPLYYIIQNIPQEYLPFPIWLLLHTIRFFILFIGCSEVCRMMSIILFLFISALRMGVRFLNNMLILAPFNQGRLLKRIIMLHSCFQIALKLIGPFQETGTGFSLIIGMLLSIMFNVATIKGFSVVPFWIYVFCPSVSLLLICACDLSFPYTHRVNELSEKLLGIAPEVMMESLFYNNFQRKITKRTIKSIKSLRIFVGFNGHNFFWMKKSTKITYWDFIITQTINILLTLPQAWMDEFGQMIVIQLSRMTGIKL
jgi:hypothetical protein